MNSLKNISRLAGIGYLLIFITGFFSNFYVLEGLIVPGDAAGTANNITNNEFMFRMGILSFILMVTFDLVLAWALYILLKHVNDNLSMLAAWFRVLNAAVFGAALYHLPGVIQLLSGEAYLSVVDKSQLQIRAMLSLSSFNVTWLIGLIFFGIHLLILGYLIIRSGHIPVILGALLIIAGFGYLADSLAYFMIPDFNDYKDVFSLIVVIPGVIGELSFTFWLLIKGIEDNNVKGVASR